MGRQWVQEAEIADLIAYNADTGEFVWLVDRKRIKAGTLAGSIDAKGYRVITIAGERYKAHRLAWFLTHGYWPGEIDHKNRVKDDNRIANLRDVTTADNAHNRGRRTDASPYAEGVSLAPWGGPNPYIVDIVVHGVRHQHRFDTLEAAERKAKEIYGRRTGSRR